MTREYLKKATLTARSGASDVSEIVQEILTDIEAGGDAKALEYAAKFDNYEGNVILSDAEIQAAMDAVPEKLKRDIEFSHSNVKRFAEAQKASMTDIAVEVVPGLTAGQKMIPVDAAGCYVPGGRYSHIASAIMTVTTAKVAGCKHISSRAHRRAPMSALRLRSSTPRISVAPTRSWPWAACRGLRR